MIPSVQQLPRLHQRALEAWEKYQAIKTEKSRLNARIKELEKAEKEQDSILFTQIGKEGMRRLPGNLILSRKVVTVPDKIITQEMVGTVATKGYSYSIYKEIEG